MTAVPLPPQEKLVGWRKKDRYRFRNPDLVAIRYETGCREVFDLHEAICDLIDEERRNRINVSPLTLATMIHDTPQGDEWAAPRVAAIEALKAKGLITFDGVATLYGELEISLPHEVWVKWHEDGAKVAQNDRPRDPLTQKFVKKTPAHSTETPTAPHGIPSGSPAAPSETEAEKEKEGMRERGSLPTEILSAIEACTSMGIGAAWWESTITKLRTANPAAPDSLFCEALLATSQEAGLQQWPTRRAWNFLRGCVRKGLEAHEAAAEQYEAATNVDVDGAAARFHAFMTGAPA